MTPLHASRWPNHQREPIASVSRATITHSSADERTVSSHRGPGYGSGPRVSAMLVAIADRRGQPAPGSPPPRQPRDRDDRFPVCVLARRRKLTTAFLVCSDGRSGALDRCWFPGLPAGCRSYGTRFSAHFARTMSPRWRRSRTRRRPRVTARTRCAPPRDELDYCGKLPFGDLWFPRWW
jgi:hypothetical protein